MAASATPPRAPPKEPVDDGLDLERARRRHPAERQTSRWSGILLLLIIPHAAFGYAMAGLVTGDHWVRTAHFTLAPFMAVLALLFMRAVARLPWRGRRERMLGLAAFAIVTLTMAQLATGLWMRWGLAGAGTLQIAHIGTGIVNTLLVACAHVIAILPSILLSARKEHAGLAAEHRR